jgi:hypothetical protein
VATEKACAIRENPKIRENLFGLSSTWDEMMPKCPGVSAVWYETQSCDCEMSMANTTCYTDNEMVGMRAPRLIVVTKSNN